MDHSSYNKWQWLSINQSSYHAYVNGCLWIIHLMAMAEYKSFILWQSMDEHKSLSIDHSSYGNGCLSINHLMEMAVYLSINYSNGCLSIIHLMEVTIKHSSYSSDYQSFILWQ